MTCQDCGADISARGVNAYLCRPCAAIRRLARGRRDHRAVMADPAKRARKRIQQAAWERAHYVPVKTPRETIVLCDPEIGGCGRTFLRHWPNNNQIYCRPCGRFYARVLENDRGRRRYAQRKRRAAA